MIKTILIVVMVVYATASLAQTPIGSTGIVQPTPNVGISQSLIVGTATNSWIPFNGVYAITGDSLLLTTLTITRGHACKLVVLEDLA